MITETAAVHPAVPGDAEASLRIAMQLRTHAETTAARSRALASSHPQRWSGVAATAFEVEASSVAADLLALAHRYDRMAAVITTFAIHQARLQAEEALARARLLAAEQDTRAARMDVYEAESAPLPPGFELDGIASRRRAETRLEDAVTEERLRLTRLDAIRDEFTALARGVVIELRELNSPSWRPDSTPIQGGDLIAQGALSHLLSLQTEQIFGGTRTIFRNEFGVVVSVIDSVRDTSFGSNRFVETDVTEYWRGNFGTEVDRAIARYIELAPYGQMYVRALDVLAQGGTLEDADEALACDPSAPGDCDVGAANRDYATELLLIDIPSGFIAGGIAAGGRATVRAVLVRSAWYGERQIAAGLMPRGFGTVRQFEQFSTRLYNELATGGYGETTAVFQGSSVTGRRFANGQPFDSGRVSDFDVALAGSDLLDAARDAGIPLRSGGVRTGPLGQEQLARLGLEGLATDLSELAGRKVSFMVFESAEEALRRGPSIIVSP